MKFFLSFNIYAYINLLFFSFIPVFGQQNANLEKKDIDEVSLYNSLSKFVELFPNRITGSERLSAASDYITTELGEYGYSCDKQVWKEKIGTETRSAINTYCISNLGLIEPSILLIAHLDIVPTTIQGAGDNGSGVSILLALAKNVAKTTASGKIIFLFSDAEEYGMVGSKKFYSELSRAFNIRHVIAVDHVASKRSDCFDLALEGQYKFIASADLYKLFHLAAQKKNICLEHAP